MKSITYSPAKRMFVYWDVGGNLKIMNIDETALTTVVLHYIKPEKKSEFEKWTKNITSLVKQFDGFQGLKTIEPPHGSNEYITLFKFSSFPALRIWMDSDERKIEIDKLEGISEKNAHLKHIEGIDFWFDSSDENSESPPKWKMSILTWAAVFPGVVILSQFYKALLPNAHSMVLTLLTTLTLVALLTWIVMPNIVKLFKKWIFK